MLIEFSVANFRSFREKQTFSMVAAPRLRKRNNVFKPDVVGEKIPELLKVAAIYGPNASGKSNLMAALRIVVLLTNTPLSAQPKPLPVAPFRFDRELLNQPSQFEFHFISCGQRYEFQLALTRDRIVHESLTGYPEGKETLLYDRRYSSSEGEVYRFGDSLEGGRDLHDTWRKLTGARVLFIVQAVANSSEDLKQLRNPYQWLESGLAAVSDDMRRWADASQEIAKQIPEFAEQISTFLQDVDVPVTSIRFEPIDSPANDELTDQSLQQAAIAGSTPSNAGSKKSKTTLTHTSALGTADFEFDEESGGTRNLIGFWLPWRVVGDGKANCTTLIVDEFDSSLHPKIVANLVRKHINSPSPKQMIFTTHDTHLMDTKLLRRDQFWLTERDMNGATQLRSIHDFDGRESEDLEKRYYEGRYRGLPFTREG